MCSSSESLLDRAVVVDRVAIAAERNGDVDAWIEAETVVDGLMQDALIREAEGR